MKRTENIKIEIVDEVIAVVKIDRPEAMNALNIQVVAELTSIVLNLEENNDIRCVIFAGEMKYFIAGADVQELHGMDENQAYQFARNMGVLHNLILSSHKPYIAAISGYCLGGGLELALACDIRLVNNNGKFGFPEVNLGIIPGGGGIQRLKELTGISMASQIMMTGEFIDADTARELRIVNEITDDVFSRAICLARTMVTKSQLAITAIKKSLNSKNNKEFAMNLEEQMDEFAKLFNYPDAYERISAFIEKRQPRLEKGEQLRS